MAAEGLNKGGQGGLVRIDPLPAVAGEVGRAEMLEGKDEELHGQFC